MLSSASLPALTQRTSAWWTRSSTGTPVVSLRRSKVGRQSWSLDAATVSANARCSGGTSVGPAIAGYCRPIDWSAAFAQRVADRGDAEITAILAGVPAGVMSVTGGFPNPRTFPTEALD